MNFLTRLTLAIVTSLTYIHAAEPIITNVLPRGGQVGSDLKVTISGNRLQGTEEIFFYGDGISVLDINATNDKSVKAKFRISKETELGQHELRLRTKSGISTLKTFWVGPYPNLHEEEPNTSFEEAQRITINHTINGVVKNEDVDYFEFNATKNQRISLEIEAIRLSGPLFDPYIAILDSNRFEVATSDDTDLLLQDSTLSTIIPQTGKYFIEVRESSYRGGNNFYYRLHVGTFPRPLIAFPAGGEVGKILTVNFMGDPSGPIKKNIQLPNKENLEFRYRVEQNGSIAPSPNAIRVCNFPSILEKEPNDSFKTATTTTLSLPLAFDGIIEKEKDVDYFKFYAKKGQKFNIHAHAQSISSPLDPVLNLYDDKGKSIKGSDDANNGRDSLITITIPQDGNYTLRVKDHLYAGGDRFVYRLESQPFSPKVEASIPMFGNRDTQTRQMIPIARGNKTATALNLSRKNFSGELEVIAENLPTGVTMRVPKAPSNFNSVPVVFEASKDAPLSQKLVHLKVRHTDPEKKISGEFKHNIALVYGPPNNRTYYESTLNKLSVGVTEKIPFSIILHPPSTPIVRGGSINLQVEAIRDANFTAPITLRIQTRPPGIGAKGTVSIAKDKSTAYYSLTANSGTSLGDWDIAVQGEANNGNGIQLASSQLTPITVEDPYLSIKINMAAIERGKEGEII
ncbi:MAG: peptidase, partial [Opitutae bacterium]|nr:peptidase [Opitutae bacterium]